MTIYVVTVVDYEHTVILGAYSTEEKARTAADGIARDRFGRFGPYVVPLEVDDDHPTPLFSDGDPHY